MNFGLKKEKLQLFGLYVVIILIFIRFFVVPYSKSVDKKKELLNNYIETYQTNTERIKRLEDIKRLEQKKLALKKTIEKKFYPKNEKDTQIQVDVLKQLIQLAVKNNLEFINFELIPPQTGKTITQIDVLLRINGQPKDFVKFLNAQMKENQKIHLVGLQIVKSADNKFLYTLTFRVYKL